jgi:dipeptidyl aminopeptidase/acylaminoacyl peptidase
VLLLHGELDQRVSIADATRVLESLPGKKQWQLFTAAHGHGSLASDDAELWRGVVSRFLQEHSAK